MCVGEMTTQCQTILAQTRHRCSKMPKRHSPCNLPRIMVMEDEEMELGSLCGFWWWKLSVEDFVPKATCNAEPVLVVCVVVLEMVPLELFVIGWKAATAVSIRYRIQSPSIRPTSCDVGSSGSSHSRCSQRSLHRTQLLLHTNHRRTLCVRACRRVLQGR